MKYFKQKSIFLHFKLIIKLSFILFIGCGTQDQDHSNDMRYDSGDSGVLDFTLEIDSQIEIDSKKPSNLWPCQNPGEKCNPHDDCAINAICGEDNLCHPQKYQDCNDNLDCTKDICKGMGICEYEILSGYCKIVDKCYQNSQRNPENQCQICDAEKDKSYWSFALGMCDDNDNCTFNDVCIDGVCKGKNSGGCDDGLICTDDICDGNGGCFVQKIKAGYCLIDGICYQDEQQDTTGCFICDVNKSQKNWFIVPNTCFIDSTCYNKGDISFNACSKCDPAKDAKGWTPLIDKCEIDGYCYNFGDKKSGCEECNPHKDAKSWTLIAGKCLINGVCYDALQQDDTKCSECNPNVDNKSFTPITGKCKIDGLCYEANDLNTTGCGKCSPSTNAKDWTPVSGKCEINGLCYNANDLNTTGCGKCSPSTNAKDWTPITGKCKINGLCYDNGYAHNSGCGQCDANSNPTSWTVTAYRCLINDICHSPNVKSSTGCGLCNPNQSKTSWTEIPNCNWAISSNGDTSNTYYDAYRVAVDGSFNVYITGNFSDTISFGATSLTSNSDEDIFVVKISPSGDVIWAKSIGGNDGDYSRGIAVDEFSNVYIAGSFKDSNIFGKTTLTSNNNYSMFVAKMSPNGDFLWAKQSKNSSYAYTHDIDLDLGANIYITGYFGGYLGGNIDLGTFSLSTPSHSLFVAKMSPNGDFLWVKSADGESKAYGITVDISNNVLITGELEGTVGFDNITISEYGFFVSKLTPSGDFLWAKSDDHASGYNFGNKIATDSSSNIYVVGSFEGVINFGSTALQSSYYLEPPWQEYYENYEMFVVKMSPNGDFLWAKEGNGENDTYGNDVLVDSSGDIYVTGEFTDKVTFGQTTLTSPLNYNPKKLYVAKLSPLGDFIAATSNDGNGNYKTYGDSIASDSNLNIYVIGAYTDTISFGTTTLSPTNYQDIFVWKSPPL